LIRLLSLVFQFVMGGVREAVPRLPILVQFARETVPVVVIPKITHNPFVEVIPDARYSQRKFGNVQFHSFRRMGYISGRGAVVMLVRERLGEQQEKARRGSVGGPGTRRPLMILVLLAAGA
jgi:hypothetical protein